MNMESIIQVGRSTSCAPPERGVHAASASERAAASRMPLPSPCGSRSGLKPALHLAFVCLVGFVITSSAPAQQPSPRLIPFQGRLTDQQGRAYTNSQYSLTFRLYSQAVGGTPIWTETHRKVRVINGMVNVFLGSITTLDPVTGPVDFSPTRHLGITIDADDNPVTADPEMVPRQMIIPAFWAKQADNSTLLAGTNLSAILVSGNNPATGFIRGDRLEAGGITTDRIKPDAITTDKIAPGAVQTSDIGDGQITVEKLSPAFQLDTVIPPGTIQAFGGPNIPAGWLLCDGSALNKDHAEYERLFTAISTNWGNGSQASSGAVFVAITSGPDQTDFNLPDLRGVFLRGVDRGAGRDPDRASSANNGVDKKRFARLPGGNLGDAVGSYQDDAWQAHRHTIGSWNPSVNDPGSGAVTKGGNLKYSDRVTTENGYLETRPKNAYVHYIIKY
jgi:hypothetical protein